MAIHGGWGGVPSARTSAGDRGSVQTGNRASFTGEGSHDDVAGSRATTGDAVGPRDRQCGAPLRSLARRRGARSVPGTHGQGTVRLQPQPWGNVPWALRPSSRGRMQPLPPPPQDRRRGLSAPPCLSLHPPVPPSDKRRRPPAPAARTRTRSLPAARAARETHRGTVWGRGELFGVEVKSRDALWRPELGRRLSWTSQLGRSPHALGGRRGSRALTGAASSRHEPKGRVGRGAGAGGTGPARPPGQRSERPRPRLPRQASDLASAWSALPP